MPSSRISRALVVAAIVLTLAAAATPAFTQVAVERRVQVSMPFDGDWRGDIQVDGSRTPLKVRLLIEGEKVTTYYSENGTRYIEQTPRFLDFRTLGNAAVVYWMTTTPEGSETQVFSLTTISDGEIQLAWVRHINSPGSRNTAAIEISTGKAVLKKFVATRNYVGNPSFESALNSWQLSPPIALARVYTHSRNNSRTGNGSLMIENSRTSTPLPPQIITQDVTGLRPNTDYRISFWVKSQTARTERSLRLFVMGSRSGPTYVDIARGTYDWRQFSVVVRTDNSGKLTLSFTTENTFTGWVDDVEVTEAQ